MSTYNPQVLLRSLEELHGDFTRWIHIIDSTAETAQRIQKLSDDQIHFAKQQMDKISAQVTENERRVDVAVTSVENALQRSRTLLQVAKERLDQALTAVTNAHHTLSCCQSALSEAKLKLQDAQNRYNTAINGLSQAEDRLAKEVNTLSGIKPTIKEYDYGAKRDIIRPNPAYEAQQRVVQSAQEQRDKAQIVVDRTKEEVERAQNRVDRLNLAVSKASQALRRAHEAEKDAKSALDRAEESLSRCQEAENATREASKKSATQMDEARQMKIMIERAEAKTYDAQVHFKNANTGINSTQSLEKRLCQDLDFRIEQLYELDRAGL